MQYTARWFPISVLGTLLVASMTACGGGQQSEPMTAAAPPPPPPPPPPVAASPPPAAPAEAAPAPPPEKKHAHHHGMASVFVESLEGLDLKPEQKTAIDGIEADLKKLGEQHGDAGKKLANDVADGVAAGKVDHKKTDPDVKELVKEIDGTKTGVQDAVNRIHKTLDADQRKKLVEAMREQAESMHEHMGEHEHGHEHGAMGGGPAGAGGAMTPPPGGPKGGPSGGPPGAPGDQAGHGGHGEHEHGDHEHGEHEHGEHEHGEHEHSEHGPMGGWPLEHLASDLGLTPEQHEKLKKKLEPQMKANQAAMKAKMDANKGRMKAMGEAFEKDTFDAKKAGVGDKASDMAKDMAAYRIEFVETVLSELTPEQRVKFAEHIRSHADETE